MDMIKNMGIKVDMFARYIDDMVIVTRAIGQGWHWCKEGKKLKWSSDQYKKDREDSADERTATVLSNITNSINTNIQTTTDLPGRNPNGRMPILDLEMWIRDVEGIPTLTHTF